MESNGVQLSHVGVGRCIDNVYIERFWWTIKWEDIHLSSYETVSEARAGIADFIKYYNEERPHQALGYKTPHEVYFGRKATIESRNDWRSESTTHRKFPTGSTAHPLPFGYEGQGRAGTIDLWTT